MRRGTWMLVGSVVVTAGLGAALWKFALRADPDTDKPIDVAKLPNANTLTAETTYVPLAGDDNRDPEHCIAATLQQIKKFANWTLRIDDMRSFRPNIDAPPWRAATIELTANGAIFRDAQVETLRTSLTPAIAAALDAAVVLPCTDGTQADGDVRYFGFGYGDVRRSRDAYPELALRAEEGTPATLALVKAFDEARVQYTAANIARARTVHVELAGRQHRAYDVSTGPAWHDRKIVIDLATAGDTDYDAIVFLAYALELPAPTSTTAGPHLLRGTARIDGKTRPIELSLDTRSPTIERLWQSSAWFTGINDFYETNWLHYDFSD